MLKSNNVGDILHEPDINHLNIFLCILFLSLLHVSDQGGNKVVYFSDRYSKTYQHR